MYKIQVRKRSPVHLDFPEGVERSKVGSLKIAPGVMVMTEHELEYIQRERPEIYKDLHVVCKFEPKTKVETVPVEQPPVDNRPSALTVLEVEAAPDDASVGGKKSKK